MSAAQSATGRMCKKIMPELPVDDVRIAVAYYHNVLGFSVNYQQQDIGVIDRDACRILLIARTEQYRGIGSCYVYVEDADALHAELAGKGASIQYEPISRPWGLREFPVIDPGETASPSASRLNEGLLNLGREACRQSPPTKSRPSMRVCSRRSPLGRPSSLPTTAFC